MKHIQFIIYLMVITHCTVGQSSVTSLFSSNEKVGDKHFERLAFAPALDAYLLALKSNEDNDTLKLKIAESYRLLNDPESASKWYGEVLPQNAGMDAAYYIHYADVLTSAGKYDEAKDWYLKYGAQTPEDGRVKEKIRGIEDIEKLNKNEFEVSINKVDWNSEFSDFSPAYYGDELLFVSARPGKMNNLQDFKWDGSNFLDIYQVNDNGSVASFNRNVNGKYHEGPLVVYDEGRKMIFTRDNYYKGKLKASKNGTTKLNLYYAERDSVSDQWGDPQPLPFNNDEYSVGHPAISEDGLTLYFVSDMPGGKGGTDIYKSEMKDGNWGEPVNLGEPINTEGNEMFPFLNHDEELFFASNGQPGLGGLDIYVIDVIKNKKVINLGAPINSNLDDFGLIIDKKEGYFSSNRDGGKNHDDIYSFTAERPFLTNYLASGTVYDKTSKAILDNAVVKLYDEGGNLLDSTYSDKNGKYAFTVDTGKKYSIKADKEDYFPTELSFKTLNSEEGLWENDLYLNSDYGFQLIGEVVLKGTEEAVPGVQVKITDNFTGKDILTAQTDNAGGFVNPLEDKKPGDRVSYQIQLQKDGYLGKNFVLNHLLKEPGPIYLKEFVDLSMDKIEVGTDIGKLVDLKPIYFDLGKSNIRKDAALELDKVVKVMKENPTLQIELGAHTDSRGSAVSNEKLSDKRAKASAAYIISQGIDASRITGKGYGESQLINECADGVKCSEEQHQNNRRTEFKVVKM